MKHPGGPLGPVFWWAAALSSLAWAAPFVAAVPVRAPAAAPLDDLPAPSAVRGLGRAAVAASGHAVLGTNRHGQLAFLELGQGAKVDQSSSLAAGGSANSHPQHKATTELYPVEVSFEVQDMRAEEGATMVFDKKNRALRLEPGIATVGSIAWGRFVDQIDTTGWAEMHVETMTGNTAANDVKMYSAGFLEGLLSCVRLSEFHANTYDLVMKREESAHAIQSIKKLFENQLAYLKAQGRLIPHVLSEEPDDAYWKQARYMLFQMWGMRDGFNYAARQYGVTTLELTDMLLLNAGGELPQLMKAYSPRAVDRRAHLAAMERSFLQRGRRAQLRGVPEVPVPVANMSASDTHATAPAAKAAANAAALIGSKAAGHMQANSSAAEDPLDDAHWEHRLASEGRCSALVRLAPGNEDIFLGHTTWDDYSKMTRVFKYYNFHLHGADTMATNIAFSSYPGAISSTDDFYTLSSGLVVAETSLMLLDESAWDRVPEFPQTPHIPHFVHVMATNRLAKTAAHWARLLSTVNAGTYTAQWMIVDYKQFVSGSPLRDNTFWVLETIPAFARMQDMTDYLSSHGYWPSMNRPYFKEVREATGHAAAERSHGFLYSWSSNPRAEIFAESVGNTKGLNDMRNLMSRNMYPNTGLKHPEPGHEISARMDLLQRDPIPNGGIDSKVVSRCLLAKMQVQAVSGPSHSVQKPFRWASDDGLQYWPGWPHDGQPNVWNFSFVQMSPTGVGAIMDIDIC